MSIANIFRKENSSKTLRNLSEKGINALLLVLVLLSILSSISLVVHALPVGPTILFNATDNATPRAAAQITTAGGSFTTLSLNVTSQTPRWKAYVGNVTGKLMLADANNKSIFDWTVTSVTGEVYATRASSVSWSGIACVNSSVLSTEEIGLNMSESLPDTINRTFSSTVHKTFYVGTVRVQNSSCRSLATYVNGTAQTMTENASFQEIMLRDSASNAVYATLINQNATGFNNQKYDFQMIVPENEFQDIPTTYYMYVELI